MMASVVICTCNGERYLCEFLVSLLAQTRLPCEVVICDDNSDDGTMAIVERFAATSPVRTVLRRNPERLGVSANFDQAIGMAGGDIVFLADQDDVWQPNKIERMLREFADPRTGLVFSDGELMDERSSSRPGTLWQTFRLEPQLQHQFATGDGFRALVRRNYITGATLAFHSRLLPVLRPIPSVWIHDHWIALIASALSGVAPVPDALIRYRVHAAQQVGTRGTNQLGAWLANLRRSAQDVNRLAAFLLHARNRLLVLQEAGAAVYADLPWLADRIRFLEWRCSLPPGTAARTVLAARALAAGCYAAQGCTWRSALRDVLFPMR